MRLVVHYATQKCNTQTRQMHAAIMYSKFPVKLHKTGVLNYTKVRICIVATCLPQIKPKNPLILQVIHTGKGDAMRGFLFRFVTITGVIF